MSRRRSGIWLVSLVLVVVLAVASLTNYPQAQVEKPAALDPALVRYLALFEPLPQMPPIPADNPQTPEKVDLGKMLYYDRRLSLGGETSCLYCHSLEYWGAEPVARSLGVEGKTHLRHSPTVLNIGFMRSQFWDGRDPDLETQALSAIKSKVAMNQDPVEVAKRLNAIPGYGKFL